MNEIPTESGSVLTIASELRRCNRKKNTTNDCRDRFLSQGRSQRVDGLVNEACAVIERHDRDARHGAVSAASSSARPGAIWAIFSFTRSITASGFSP